MAGGQIESMGFSPRERMLLFYMICIPLRLSLVSLLYKFEDHKMFTPIMIVMACVSISMNLNKSDVWWSRKTHLLNALSVLLVALAGYPKYIKYILLSDIVGGAILSIKKSPWDEKPPNET